MVFKIRIKMETNNGKNTNTRDHFGFILFQILEINVYIGYKKDYNDSTESKIVWL